MNFHHVILYFIKPWQRKYTDFLPGSSPSVLLLTLGACCRARNIPSLQLGFDSSFLLRLQVSHKRGKKKKNPTKNQEELQQINKSVLLDMLFLLKF